MGYGVGNWEWRSPVQNLGYAAWDMRDHDELHRGRLPLAPGATLTWLGFTEEGLLACGDSSGVVSVRVKQVRLASASLCDTFRAKPPPRYCGPRQT